jgi:hypothetical protein
MGLANVVLSTGGGGGGGTGSGVSPPLLQETPASKIQIHKYRNAFILFMVKMIEKGIRKKAAQDRLSCAAESYY